MEPVRAARALADASASLTRTHDVTDALVSLVASCREGLAVDAVGILVERDGRLELLVASSHEAAELEVHQLHDEEGPCVDAHRLGATVQVSTRDDLLRCWPTFGETMLAAGFASVHATPLMWHGQAFGAIGVFRRTDAAFTDDEHAVARAFADIATMLVVHLDEVLPDELARRLELALAGRVVVEQAKGVLADQRTIGMGAAYAALVREAADAEMSLTQWATRVVQEAHDQR